VKIGLVGLGHLGKLHLKTWLAFPKIDVAGVFDIDPAKTRRVAAEFGVKAAFSFEELVEKSEGVDLVTPTITHYDLGKKVLEAGRDLFVEKPLTSHLDEGQKLIELAESKGRLLFVGHIERFNPAFEKLLSFSPQPLFIEVHRLASFSPRNLDVDVVLDLMIHDLDLVLKLVPGRVFEVRASLAPVLSAQPDIANARLAFENGCVVNLTASRISVAKMRKFRIFQKEAYFSLDLLEKNLEAYALLPTSSAIPPEELVRLPLSFGERAIGMTQFAPPWADMLTSELSEFAAACQKKTVPRATPAEALEALRLAHKISKAGLSSLAVLQNA
jgi:predicted dehydrogenase